MAFQFRRGARGSLGTPTGSSETMDLMVQPASHQSQYLSSGYDGKKDLLANINKITQALDDFDDMFNKENEDSLLSEITEQVENLEGGQLKYQMKQFIGRYKDMSSAVEDSTSERDTLLLSLSDWLEGMALDTDFDVNQNDHLETKMNLSKLKNVTQEIEMLQLRGKDVSHLEHERRNIQKNVIDKMKQKPTKKTLSSQDEAHLQRAWTHAANEICELLQKSRMEKNFDLTMVLNKVKGLTDNLNQMEKEKQKLRRQLKEKEYAEDKWQEDNTYLSGEKAKIEAKLRKVKKELRKTYKSLSKYEVVPPKKFEADDDEDEPPVTPKKSVEKAAPSPENEKRIKKEKALEKKIEDLNKEIQKFKASEKKIAEQVSALLLDVGDKEERIQDLENDKMELIHQMKQASVRPDTRHLSQESRHGLGSISSIPVAKVSSSHASEKIKSSRTKSNTSEQCTCDCHSGSTTSLASSVVSATKESGTNVTVSVVMKQVENVPKKSAGNQGEKSLLLKRQLKEANDKIAELQKKVKHMETAAKKQAAEKVPSVVRNERHKPKKPVIEHEKQQNKDDEEHHADRNQTSRSMQTDPNMDPIGHWSKGIEKNRSWRPPMPPANWINFDPTAPGQKPDDGSKEDLHLAMLKGAEPAEVRREASNATQFIEMEMNRVLSGITGFVDYINSMVDREVKMMAAANRELKNGLNKSDLKKIEKLMSTPPSSNLKGSIMSMSPRPSVEKKGGENEILNYLDHLVPVEERVKESINKIAQEALDTLRAIYEQLYSSFHNEHRQYEEIYTIVTEKSGENIFTDNEKKFRESHADLMPKKSLSHGEIVDDAPIGSLGFGRSGYLMPRKSQSAFADGTRRASFVHRPSIYGDKPLMEKTSGQRSSLAMSSATIPKTGQIKIQADKAKETSEEQKEVMKKRKRPAPRNFNKMASHRKALASMEVSEKETPEKTVVNQLPDNYFGTYTIMDLEKRMEKIQEANNMKGRHDIIEKMDDINFFKNPSSTKSTAMESPSLFPPLQANQSVSRGPSPQPGSADPAAGQRLPPIEAQRTAIENLYI